MSIHKILRWPVTVFALAGFGLALSFAAPQAAGAELQQDVEYECEWNNGPRLPAKVQLAAGAVDYNENVLYIYGGQNEQNDVQNSFMSVDFSTAAQPNQASAARLSPGPIERVAATGFYRPSKEADKKGSVYFLFGSDDLGYPAAAGGSGNREGNGTDDVIQYNIESGQWRQVSVSGQAIRDRLLAAAAYDRDNDVAIVTGGITKCAVEDFLPPNLGGNGQACRPTQFPAVILEFDDNGDITVKQGPSGGPTNVIGHTMSYDPNGKRMLVHGGSTDGEKGIGTTWSLDTSNLSAASWTRLGNGPTMGLHAGAYNSDLNWLMAHGGGVANLLLPNETVNNDTYGMSTPAMGGPDWSDLDASTSPADRVNHVGGYISNGQMMGFVVASGRRKNARDGSATIVQNTDVLTCQEVVAPPTNTPAPPTNTPDPAASPTPDTAPPSPTPVNPAEGITVCTQAEGKVPGAARNAASANPSGVAGYNTPCNPNTPFNPVTNPLRKSLGLRNPNLPFHPIYNGLVLKCGCP